MYCIHNLIRACMNARQKKGNMSFLALILARQRTQNPHDEGYNPQRRRKQSISRRLPSNTCGTCWAYASSPKFKYRSVEAFGLFFYAFLALILEKRSVISPRRQMLPIMEILLNLNLIVCRCLIAWVWRLIPVQRLLQAQHHLKTSPNIRWTDNERKQTRNRLGTVETKESTIFRH